MTGIDVDILLGADISGVSIAKRMCWVSRRETSRIEDLAYCLMGIFGVNMPLLYDEGSDSFLRLQEEIIKTSEGQSIFAWTWEAKIRRVSYSWTIGTVNNSFQGGREKHAYSSEI
jgi:hypothetical protein